jgi:hypothetical protein
MKTKPISKEILFITHSSKDDKGKRVIVRLDNTENVVYPGEIDDPILKVIGLDSVDVKRISEFFGIRSKVTYPQREERLF